MVSTRAKSRTAVAPRRRLSRKFPVGGSEFLLRALLTLVISLVSTREGLAQWNADEVHVLPRPTARSQPSTPPTLRANVDMVLVNVTVLDRAGRAVRGLDAANFSILDGKHRQSVRYVSNADEPISLVVVLDASASMAPRILQERKAVTTLMSTSNPQDEIGLIAVGDRPQVIASFDDPMDKAQSALAGIQPDGETALWDAMYLGLKELKNAHHQRKAMVVISDGGDNHSRYSESELRSLLKEADVAVYAIGMFNRYARRREEKAGPLQLDEVTP